MNTDKIKQLSNALESIKTARFYTTNIASNPVFFKTSFSINGESMIKSFPLNYRKEMTEDLNEAIQPVLEKYAKIFEEAIRKEAGL